VAAVCAVVSKYEEKKMMMTMVDFRDLRLIRL
jgi:hypothetical protein